MVIYNQFSKCYDLIKDEVVNGEHLTLTVSHKLEESEFSGWFVSITTHDEVTDETDWGFCSGWLPSYPEAIGNLKANISYKRYPFPC